MPPLELFAQAVDVDPVVRFDIDDIADLILLLVVWIRVAGGRNHLVNRVLGRKEPSAILETNPKTHEVEVVDGIPSVRITLENGTVRVEPLDEAETPPPAL